MSVESALLLEVEPCEHLEVPAPAQFLEPYMCLDPLPSECRPPQTREPATLHTGRVEAEGLGLVLLAGEVLVHLPVILGHQSKLFFKFPHTFIHRPVLLLHEGL